MPVVQQACGAHERKHHAAHTREWVAVFVAINGPWRVPHDFFTPAICTALLRVRCIMCMHAHILMTTLMGVTRRRFLLLRAPSFASLTSV